MSSLSCVRSGRGPWAALLLLLTLAAAGCGGAGAGNQPTTTISTPTAAGASATTAARPSPSPLPTPAASATATRGPVDRQQVIDAATAALGARALSPLTRDACLADNPQRLPCIELVSPPASLQAGLARFAGGYPDGNRFELFLGRSSDGAWSYWYSTQQPSYTATELPAGVIACGGREGVSLRQAPSTSAPALATLATGTELQAEEFLLSAAGTPPAGRGEGWYRVSGAAQGWISARDAAGARFGDCAFRDEIEGTGPHG